MVRAVGQYVEQHLFSAHRPEVTVREQKRDGFLQRLLRERGHIALVPKISLRDSRVKFAEVGSVWGVRRLVLMRLPEQMCAEDSINDIDVIEHARGGEDRRLMRGRGTGRHGIEEFPIGPGFLREK